MKVEHKLEKGKLIHKIIETKSEFIAKAMDTQTAGEGYEWKSESYAKTRIHKVKLSEIKELKKAKFLLRKTHWRGQFTVRGMSVDHWDLLFDKGEKCLDEFSSMMNNPLEKPEGVNCIRRNYCIKTPEGKANKEWINFVDKSIPSNHPEWGNPNRRIPVSLIKVDAGSVNIVADTENFVSFVFHGKLLKGYWIAKREDPRSEIWVFSKSALPGEPKKEIKHVRHRRDQCMKCSKPPVYEILWANGIGRCWFCLKHFKEWATNGDGKGEICSVKEIKNGMVTKKWKENTNPNIWNQLKRNL